MNRNQIVVVLIVSLVVFNVIQWWPNTEKNEQIDDWQEIKVSDLKINGIGSYSAESNNTRDLFYKDDDVIDAALINKSEIKNTPVNEDANTSLSGIKLIGVIFKNNHYEAFLSHGEEKFKVGVNEYIARRYKVKYIDIKSIKLKDMQTERMHNIIISDE